MILQIYYLQPGRLALELYQPLDSFDRCVMSDIASSMGYLSDLLCALGTMALRGLRQTTGCCRRTLTW